MRKTVAGRAPRIEEFASAELVATISRQQVVVYRHERAAPSPVVCSALPSSAARQQRPRTSTRLAPPLAASPACSNADIPAHGAGRIRRAISPGSRAGTDQRGVEFFR
jgi:hypothetical protein